MSGIAVAGLAGMAALVALLSFGVAWQGLQVWRRGPQPIPTDGLATVEGMLAESRLEGAGAKQALRLRLVGQASTFVVRGERLGVMELKAFRRDVGQGTPLRLQVRQPADIGVAKRQERVARRGVDVFAIATAQRSYLSPSHLREQDADSYAWAQVLVLPILGAYALLVLVVLLALRRRRRSPRATAEQP